MLSHLRASRASLRGFCFRGDAGSFGRRSFAAFRSTSGSPLISSDELSSLIITGTSEHNRLHIIDCVSSLPLFERAHIPGAKFIDLPPKIKSAGGKSLISENEFRDAMLALGISNDHSIVVYDAEHNINSSRLWWALRYFGCTNVKVLNGGWLDWVRSEKPCEIGQDQTRFTQPSSQFEIRTNPLLLAELPEVVNAASNPDVQILDCRTPGEFEGIDTRGNMKSGHVPSAENVSHTLFTDNSGKLKSVSELQELVSEIGFSSEKQTITYCQAGIRAALGQLVLEAVGFSDVKNYDGSMAEYLNSPDTPVEKGH